MLLGGCEEQRGEGEERAARPGVVQVAGADGPLIDEDEACERLHTVLSATRDELSCGNVDVLECPSLVRPAGSAACRRFSEESVAACEAIVAEYEDCEDFRRRRCYLVVVLDESSPDCVPPEPSQPDAGEGPVAGDAAVGDAAADTDTDPDLADAGAPGASEADASDGVDGSEPGATDAGRQPLGPRLDAAVTRDAGEAEPDAAMQSAADAAADPVDAGSAGQ